MQCLMKSCIWDHFSRAYLLIIFTIDPYGYRLIPKILHTPDEKWALKGETEMIGIVGWFHSFEENAN